MSSTVNEVLRRVRHSRTLFPPEGFGRISLRLKRESRRNPDWTPDPFDVAQGRGELSRTTIKTFGGDDFGVASLLPQPQFSKDATKST